MSADDAEQQRQRLELRAGVEQRGDLQRAAVDQDARLERCVPAGRCSTSSRIWLPSTVTVVK